MTGKWLLDSGEMNFKTFYLYWGALMEHFLPHLAQSIQTGKDMDLYTWIESQPEVSRNFQQGMIQLARYVAGDIAKVLPLPTHARRLLDVGGGHGEYSLALCKANPNLSAVIFDSKQALVTGQQSIGDAAMTDRMSVVVGNFMQDKLPEGFDVALLFNILHGLTPAQNAELLARVKQALNPGGQVVILEQVHNITPLPLTNTVSHLLSLAYYHLIGGQVYTADEIDAWLLAAGFGSVHHKSVLKASSVLISATWSGTQGMG